MPRCDCPNCDAPGSYKFDFCTSSNSDSTDSTDNSDSTDSSSAQNSSYDGYQAQSYDNTNANADESDDTVESSQQDRSKQSATSMLFNPIAYVVAGSAVVLLVGALLFRKRVSFLLWRGKYST
jgi:cobalamin biosynthesis Mg chelatase CobN